MTVIQAIVNVPKQSKILSNWLTLLTFMDKFSEQSQVILVRFTINISSLDSYV